MLETQRTGGFHERMVGFWVILPISLFLRMAIVYQNCWLFDKYFFKDGGYGIKRITLITIVGLGPSDTHSTLVPTPYIPPRKEGGWGILHSVQESE
jgi:hypothetical protein